MYAFAPFIYKLVLLNLHIINKLYYATCIHYQLEQRIFSHKSIYIITFLYKYIFSIFLFKKN